MTYKVLLPRAAQKALDRLPDDVAERLLKKLALLEVSARPADSKKLKGRDAWRVRVGDYRVIYEIDDRLGQVVVVVIGHCREVYR